MTDLDDLPFHDGQESPPTGNGAKGAKPCRRHQWELRHDAGAAWTACARCGRLADPEARRRGRLSNTRGKAIQRKRITTLGGRNLAGNNPNLDGIGELFRYESKSGASFPERPWRWLKGIACPAGQIGVLIITDTPGPGHRARSVVIVDFDDWRDLHGELGPDVA